ncbi:MAG: DegV family protein [Coprobacillus sp.]
MYQIVSDGSCDLDQSIIDNLNIKIVPFYITKDGETHYKEREELEVEEFYQFMVDNKGVFPKTSMPSVQDYLDVFEPILKDKQDIICICITTKFSGSYNSANTAKQMLEDEYPHQRITIIDACVNTVLQGLLVLEAVKMRDNGFDYEKNISQIEELKITGRIFFTVDGFDYLIHGGRIGKVAGVAAKTLGIKPLIVLKDGEIFASGVCRGREKSKRKVIENVIKHFQDNQLNIQDYALCVGYGYDREEGKLFLKQLQSTLEETFGEIDDILIQHIGATIGVHTGPYPLGVGLIHKYK